jgi:hypothetical protein
MSYYILNRPYPPSPKTARDVSDDTSRHAFHDSKRVDGAYMKAGAATILGSTFIGAATAIYTKSPELTATNIALFNMGVSVYLGRVVEEVRSKIDHFRENYALSEGSFTERDQKLTSQFKDEIFAQRPTLAAYAKNVKEHPFSSVVAMTGLGLSLATRSPALGTLCMSIFMVTLAAEESTILSNIHKKASKSRKMIETCNKLGIL